METKKNWQESAQITGTIISETSDWHSAAPFVQQLQDDICSYVAVRYDQLSPGQLECYLLLWVQWFAAQNNKIK